MKVFSFNDKRNGSYIDGVSGAVGVNTNGQFVRSEKGLTWRGVDAESNSVLFSTISNTFDGNVGSMVTAMRPFDTGKGTTSSYASLRVNSDNNIGFLKIGVGNEVRLKYKSGGVENEIIHSWENNKWGLFIITWDKLKDEVIGYVNGEKTGSTLTGLGTWAGSPDARIGFADAGAYASIDCSNLKCYNHILTAKERATLYKEFLDAGPIQRRVE